MSTEAAAVARAECARLIADDRGFVRDLEFTTVQASGFLLLAEEAKAFEQNSPTPSPLVFRALTKVLKRDIVLVEEPTLVAGTDANVDYDAYVSVYHCGCVHAVAEAGPLQLHLDRGSVLRQWHGSSKTTWGT